MSINQLAHKITFSKNGKLTEYLFDKNSKDVEFVKYIKNSVVNDNPRIEEIIEEWYIKSLEEYVEIRKTLKYNLNSKIAERRDWKSFGNVNRNNNTLENTNIGEDVFIEWLPSILDNPKNKNYIEKYCHNNKLFEYTQNSNSTTQDLIYINDAIYNELNDMEKYKDLISRTNNISNNMNKVNKNKKLQYKLPIAKSFIENNVICKDDTLVDSNNIINSITKINNNGDSKGLFVPVHQRSGFNNIIRNNRNNNESNRNDNESNRNIFKVHKKMDQPRFTFVIKGIPDPETVNQNDILDALCNTSYTLRENDRLASVFIIKDKNTRKQKNMCLVNFRNEDIKNKVLNECLSSRILFNNCILSVEDGHNN